MKDFPRVLKAGFFFGVGLLGVLIFSGPVFAGSLLEGWTGDVFAGYNQSGGNTDKGAGSIAAQAVKKWETSSFTLKGSAFYSQSNNKMDGQKWDALAKYSYDFGKDDLWFNFYQVLVDHDYFADIDYRVTPATAWGIMSRGLKIGPGMWMPVWVTGSPVTALILLRTMRTQRFCSIHL